MAKRVLVAPINWGLGHATRCIPIIKAFLQQGAEVILASDGRAFELLRQEFPDLIIEKLPAYNINYQSNNMLLNMSVQSFKILSTIIHEHWVLQKLIKKYQIDIVVSDNRFGCFSKKVICIYITHQINIRLPNQFLQWVVRFINRFFIGQFDECWIPDVQGQHNLGGELDQTAPLAHLRYIGILSRMKPMELPHRYDAIVVLSGPEPQRTRLEEAILQQIVNLPCHFLVVQGKPEEGGFKRTRGSENKRLKERETEGLSRTGHVEIVPFLNATALNEGIAASDVVICRSGYSTIMDLAILEKPAIFIPTPGQTEQEYLAERLFENGFFYFQKQDELNLAAALQAVKNFPGLKRQHYQSSAQQLQQAVQHVLAALPNLTLYEK